MQAQKCRNCTSDYDNYLVWTPLDLQHNKGILQATFERKCYPGKNCSASKIGEFSNMHCTCSPDSSSCSCSLPFSIWITVATERNMYLNKKRKAELCMYEKNVRSVAQFNYWNPLKMLSLINIHKLFPVLWNSETTMINSWYKDYASKPWYLFQFIVFFFFLNCDTL